jgi:pSer/pThr/pTyr-binding forkhead associated (FHA) protein
MVSQSGSDLTAPTPPSAAPQLAVLDGTRAGQTIPVVDAVVFGRAEGADIIVDDREMSRRHAVFRANGGALEVEDLGSLNGTWVDGVRIESRAALSPGSVVKLGQTHVEVVGPVGGETEAGVETAPAKAPMSDALLDADQVL